MVLGVVREQRWVLVRTKTTVFEGVDADSGECTMRRESSFCDDGAQFYLESGIYASEDDEAALIQMLKLLPVLGSVNITPYPRRFSIDAKTWEELRIPGRRMVGGSSSPSGTGSNLPTTGDCPYFDSSTGDCYVYNVAGSGEDCLHSSDTTPPSGWTTCIRYEYMRDTAATGYAAGLLEKPVIGTAGSGKIWAEVSVYFDEVFSDGVAQTAANLFASNVLDISQAGKGITESLTFPLNSSLEPNGELISVAHDFKGLKTTVTYATDATVPECMLMRQASSVASAIQQNNRYGQEVPGIVQLVDDEDISVLVRGQPIMCRSRVGNVGAGCAVLVYLPRVPRMGNHKGYFVMMHAKRTLPGSGGISFGDRAFTMRHGCLVPQTVEGPKLYDIDRVALDAVLAGGESVLHESTWGGLVITDTFFFAVAKDGGTLVFEDRTAEVPARALWGAHVFSGRDWIMFEQALFILSPVSGLHVSVFKEGAESFPPFDRPGEIYVCVESHTSGPTFLGDIGKWCRAPWVDDNPFYDWWSIWGDNWSEFSPWAAETEYEELPPLEDPENPPDLPDNCAVKWDRPAPTFCYLADMLHGNAASWSWSNGMLFLGGWVFLEPGGDYDALMTSPVTGNVFMMPESNETRRMGPYTVFEGGQRLFRREISERIVRFPQLEEASPSLKSEEVKVHFKVQRNHHIPEFFQLCGGCGSSWIGDLPP